MVRPTSRVLSLAWMLVLGAVVPAATIDCGSGGTGGGGGSAGGGGDNTCVGGVFVNGKCEGKCDPALCVAGNVCVGNRCVLPCDAHTDCALDGTQACTPAIEDDTEAPINVCLASGKIGFGAACPEGNECDGITACPNGVACGLSQCAGAGACAADDTLCPEDSPGCGLGYCPDLVTVCTVPTCADTECLPLYCQTSGDGDATAYCTVIDCHSDGDCAPGFECAKVREAGTICGDNSVGNHPACGTTSDPCVPEADLGANGSTLEKGSLCLLRSICLKKDACSPCASDLDCTATPDRYCTDVGGTTVCAKSCGSNSDCFPDNECIGNRCVPKFGACTGMGGFCEPCRNDLDCGAPGSAIACGEISGGMHACFDFNFPDACTVDGDCPDAPGGKSGECLDEAEGLAAGDSVYHRCYYPKNEATSKFSCW